MNPPDEFLKHAADCEQMAKFTRDPESIRGTAWQRDGVDVLRYSQAKTQRHANKCRQGHIGIPFLVGLITKV